MAKETWWSSNVDENSIYLTNVIAASEIWHNLISLRRFADAGFGIYLGDKILKIFDKSTNGSYLTSKYCKPNWVINLDVKNYLKDQYYNSYSCHARLVSLDD